jgi:arsenite/tail-anchored protein-transporting ATPase
LQFILFGGKGGVGKTTMSAASAIFFAKKNPKKKILIFTTDPAPSLSDSFGQKLTDNPSKVRGLDNLWALEIDAKEELKKFKKQYGENILDILQEGTYLSNEETEEMFSLDIPGLDEVMGLKKIIDFMAPAPEQSSVRGKIQEDSEHFDIFILDTAPTGHTLRLLTLPGLLDNWIKFLASLRWKYHAMIDQFSRGKEKRITKSDEFLLEMKKTVKKVQALLRDPNKTTFVAVAIPEAMCVEETKDLINNLNKSEIPIQHIIINNIVPSNLSSYSANEKEETFLQSRRKLQESYINEFENFFPKIKITKIELEKGEIKGIMSLTKLGEKLYG